MRQRKEEGGAEPEPRKRRSPRGVAKPAFAPNPMDLQKLRAGKPQILLALALLRAGEVTAPGCGPYSFLSFQLGEPQAPGHVSASCSCISLVCTCPGA